jgi:hypothetical protein
VEARDVQETFREKLGIRLGNEMAKYVLRRLNERQGAGLPLGEIPIMGGDAKTGVAVRTMAPLNLLAAVQT